MESRKINIMFQKSGSGSIATRAALPKKWIDEIGITADDREAIIEFDREKIVIRKMNETDKLIERIDRAIEEKIMNTGAFGTERITVFINLTEDEEGLFHEIEKYDSENYFWEFDKNRLVISYTEEATHE